MIGYIYFDSNIFLIKFVNYGLEISPCPEFAFLFRFDVISIVSSSDSDVEFKTRRFSNIRL